MSWPWKPKPIRPFVQAIVKSMTDEPREWKCDIYTIRNEKAGVHISESLSFLHRPVNLKFTSAEEKAVRVASEHIVVAALESKDSK